MLYRGIKSSEQEFIQTLEKRHLTGTKILYNKWIDSAFIKVFGEAARDSCFFCTKSIEEARKYGNVYEITPSEPFHFYYSNYINDLHDVNWVKAKLYSGEEFDEEQVAGFLIRAWTADRTKLKGLFFQMKSFLEVQHVGEVISKFPDAGKRFVEDFYKKGNNFDDFAEVRKSAEIMLICDSIKCRKY